jgi:hypothetical protein
MLTIEMLRNFLEGLRPEVRNDWSQRQWQLFLFVGCHFLGSAWVEDHILNQADEPTSGFLKVEFSRGDQIREAKSLRVAHLAEMLFNLQGIPGFEGWIARMRSGGQIESTFAELAFGKLLYINGVSFRFVIPQGRKKGEDYDFELTYPDGTVVCADAKCKLEGSAPRASSIGNSLSRARKQLPEDQPGIIFVKVPQHWLEVPEIRAALKDEATKFFRGTSRVVSVKYYTDHYLHVRDGIVHTHLYREIDNPKNRFDPNRNWKLLQSGDPATSWNGLPDNWIRLIDAPKELGLWPNAKPL